MSDPISNISSGSAAMAASRVPIQSLGQEDFIKILVAQLTTQDPMNPQKDTEFVAQMAQFSQLESSKDMRAELENMRMQQDFVQANSLIGRQVQFAEGANGASFVGTVTGMRVTSGEPMVTVGDQSFFLSDVVRVDQAAATSGTYPK
jgi:flagellar basal-body rod modification protein FlgD